MGLTRLWSPDVPSKAPWEALRITGSAFLSANLTASDTPRRTTWLSVHQKLWKLSCVRVCPAVVNRNLVQKPPIWIQVEGKHINNPKTSFSHKCFSTCVPSSSRDERWSGVHIKQTGSLHHLKAVSAHHRAVGDQFCPLQDDVWAFGDGQTETTCCR